MVLVHSCLFTLFSIILFSCFSPFFKVHITYVNVIEVNDLLAINNDDPIFRGSGQPFDRKNFSWTYCCKIIRLTVIIQTLIFVITTQLNHNQRHFHYYIAYVSVQFSSVQLSSPRLHLIMPFVHNYGAILYYDSINRRWIHISSIACFQILYIVLTLYVLFEIKYCLNQKCQVKTIICYQRINCMPKYRLQRRKCFDVRLILAINLP